MAGFAICRKAGCDMRWVDCLVVIVFMASHACVRGVVIISRMAGEAIIGQRHMGPGKEVIIVVVRECRRLPLRLRGMA